MLDLTGPGGHWIVLLIPFNLREGKKTLKMSADPCYYTKGSMLYHTNPKLDRVASLIGNPHPANYARSGCNANLGCITQRGCNIFLTNPCERIIIQ